MFTNNLTRHHAYGVMGRDHAPGKDSLDTYFPDATFTSNVLAGGDAGRYPKGNRFPSAGEFRAQFAGYDAGDYRLVATSPWRGAGSDGADLGAGSLTSQVPSR